MNEEQIKQLDALKESILEKEEETRLFQQKQTEELHQHLDDVGEEVVSEIKQAMYTKPVSKLKKITFWTIGISLCAAVVGGAVYSLAQYNKSQEI